MSPFAIDGPNEKDRQLLVEFDVIIEGFLKLKPAYQTIIADITKRMGNGMAHYATAGIHVNTTADYDEYCHYVAGLVGLGLSEMFSACGFECKDAQNYVVAWLLTPCDPALFMTLTLA